MLETEERALMEKLCGDGMGLAHGRTFLYSVLVPVGCRVDFDELVQFLTVARSVNAERNCFTEVILPEAWMQDAIEPLRDLGFHLERTFKHLDEWFGRYLPRNTPFSTAATALHVHVSVALVDADSRTVMLVKDSSGKYVIPGLWWNNTHASLAEIGVQVAGSFGVTTVSDCMPVFSPKSERPRMPYELQDVVILAQQTVRGKEDQRADDSVVWVGQDHDLDDDIENDTSRYFLKYLLEAWASVARANA